MKKSGFTVMELLVSVGIVISLTGIILFVVNRLITKGRAIRIAGDIDGIKKGIIMYFSDTNFFPSPQTLNDDGYPRLITNPLLLSPPLNVIGWQGPYIEDKQGQTVFFQVVCSGVSLGCGKTGSEKYEQVISVVGITQPLLKILDEILDDKNLSSGYVRWNGQNLEIGVLKLE